MVKGVTRRVVVVKSPGPKNFEQAIFLLREDAPEDVDAEAQVLKQAQRVADDYLAQSLPRSHRILPPVFFMALGGALATLIWTGINLGVSLPF